MTARDETEHTADEHDPVALRIVEDERRRSGAFLRDYLARHRIDVNGTSDKDAPPGADR